MLAAILLIPTLLFRSITLIIFTDDAASEEIFSHFFNDWQQLQFVRKMRRNSFPPQQASHDITANGTGGITVSGMVHTADNGILEGVPVLGGTVEGNGQGLMAP